MRPASDELLETVRASHQVSARARVVGKYETGIDPDGDEIEVFGGDVESDASADIRGTLDLTTDGTDWVPRPGELLSPYGNEVFVEAGVVTFGGLEWVPLGYYRIGNVDSDTVDGSLRVAGQDRMAGIKDSKLMKPVQFRRTATVADAFARLVHDVYPDAVISFDWLAGDDELGRSLIASGDEADSDNDRYAFLRDLADARGKVIFFDHAGVLRVEDAPDPSEPVVTVTTGEGGVLVSAARSLDREGVYNAVVAEGEAADDKEPARAVVYDSNPDSPTYFYGRFGQVPKFYRSSKLTTDAMAIRAASKMLGESMGLPYNVDLSAVPNPALEAGDPIEVGYRDGRHERHRLSKVTTGLSAEDDWKASTREQTILGMAVL